MSQNNNQVFFIQKRVFGGRAVRPSKTRSAHQLILFGIVVILFTGCVTPIEMGVKKLPVTYASEVETLAARSVSPTTNEAVIFVVRRRDSYRPAIGDMKTGYGDTGQGFAKITVNGEYCAMLVSKSFYVTKMSPGSVRIDAMTCGESGNEMVFSSQPGKPLWGTSLVFAAEAGHAYYIAVDVLNDSQHWATSISAIYLNQVSESLGRSWVEKSRICTSRPP